MQILLVLLRCLRVSQIAVLVIHQTLHIVPAVILMKLTINSPKIHVALLVNQHNTSSLIAACFIVWPVLANV
jgi:hypothetical protein